MCLAFAEFCISNCSGLKEYIASNTALMKTLWPRSSINDLNKEQSLFKFINHKLKDCNYQISKCSKNTKQNISYRIRILNYALLNNHGIETLSERCLSAFLTDPVMGRQLHVIL